MAGNRITRGFNRLGIGVAVLVALSACVTDQAPTARAETVPEPAPQGPTRYDLLKAKAQGPWRHVPPVSNHQLEKDKAKCRSQMAMVPINPINSPAVVEMRLYSFFIDCMQAEGYVAP